MSNMNKKINRKSPVWKKNNKENKSFCDKQFRNIGEI